jgi:hypothetical protein
VARNSKTKRRLKKRRRAKNKLDQEALLKPSDDVRVRTEFHGKARRGDEVGLDAKFSDTSVPYDPDAPDPSEGVSERHEAVKAWDRAGNPTSGDA